MTRKGNTEPDLIPDLEIEIPSPLIRCIESCMTNCVAECCGIDAFDSSVEQIRRWTRENPAARIRKAALQADELLEKIACKRYHYLSRQLNHYTCDDEARKELFEFIGNIATTLKEKVTTRTNH